MLTRSGEMTTVRYLQTTRVRLPCPCDGLPLGFLSGAFAHTPRPSSRACRGLLSPGRCWQLSPVAQRPVYTPHAWPSVSGQVMQHPQPGSFTGSAQSQGSGLHSTIAPSSHGSQRTTGLTLAVRRAKAASSAVRQSAHSPVMEPKRRRGRCVEKRCVRSPHLDFWLHWSLSSQHMPWESSGALAYAAVTSVWLLDC